MKRVLSFFTAALIFSACNEAPQGDGPDLSQYYPDAGSGEGYEEYDGTLPTRPSPAGSNGGSSSNSGSNSSGSGGSNGGSSSNSGSNSSGSGGSNGGSSGGNTGGGAEAVARKTTKQEGCLSITKGGNFDRFQLENGYWGYVRNTCNYKVSVVWCTVAASNAEIIRKSGVRRDLRKQNLCSVGRTFTFGYGASDQLDPGERISVSTEVYGADLRFAACKAIDSFKSIRFGYECWTDPREDSPGNAAE